MVPASGGCTPQSTFTIVLLPAPFSPRRAWISPASHENSAPSSATTPPNRLSIPVALRRGMTEIHSQGVILSPHANLQNLVVSKRSLASPRCCKFVLQHDTSSV